MIYWDSRGFILDSRMTFSWKMLLILGLILLVAVGLVKWKSCSKGKAGKERPWSTPGSGNPFQEVPMAVIPEQSVTHEHESPRLTFSNGIRAE